MLHTKKQAAAGRPFVTGLQYVLRETPLGPLFFGSVAKVTTVTTSLRRRVVFGRGSACYPSAVRTGYSTYIPLAKLGLLPVDQPQGLAT